MSNEKATCMPKKEEGKWVPGIRFVNATMAEIIIREKLPGLYIQLKDGKFIGIDTHAGEARTEEFCSKLKCIDWLVDSVRSSGEEKMSPAQFPDKETVERIRRDYPEGCRVELVCMDDAQAPPIGTKGTVRGVDDIGSIMVSWDNGSSLHVIYGVDECRKLSG